MGRPPKIDRQSILETGLALADTEGVHAVTMQSVANALGVTPMALYRHIGTKDELLKGLVELFVADIRLPPTTLPWRDRLHGWMRAVREAAHDQPELFLLFFDRHRSMPDTRGLHDALRLILHEADIRPAELDHVAKLITMVTIGTSAYSNNGWWGFGVDDADPEFVALQRMIDDFVDGHR